MKNIEIEGITYSVYECTAIALDDHEREERRQDALFVTGDFETGQSAHVVFGWSYDDLESEADFLAMCEDSSAWESLSAEHLVQLL